jgi:hypothetical protein
LTIARGCLSGHVLCSFQSTGGIKALTLSGRVIAMPPSKRFQTDTIKLTMAPIRGPPPPAGGSGNRRRSGDGNHHHAHNNHQQHRMNPYGAVAMMVEDDGHTTRQNRNRTTAHTANNKKGSTIDQPNRHRPQHDQQHQQDRPPHLEHDSAPLPKHITVDKSAASSGSTQDRSRSRSRSNNTGSSSSNNKTATHFLIKLSGACEKHALYHPELSAVSNINKKRRRQMLRPPPTPSILTTELDGNNTNGTSAIVGVGTHAHTNHRIPEQCFTDMHTCRLFVPKLKEKMLPPLSSSFSSSPRGNHYQQQQHLQLLDDVVHFCHFIQSTLNGDYCPHMAELFGWGRDVHIGMFHVIVVWGVGPT